RPVSIRVLQFSSQAASAAAAASAAPGSHSPVLADAVTELLVGACQGTRRPGSRILLLDATFGAGGHTRRLLRGASEASTPITVYANDRDPAAYRLAGQLSESLPPGSDSASVVPLLGKFSQLAEHAELTGVEGIDGALFDLGLCSAQLDEARRGFALSADGPLDMRMGGPAEADSPTAADLVNGLETGDLAALFRAYGEESMARRLARAVVERRSGPRGPLRTTKQLADCLADAVGSARRKDSLGRSAHPATRVFQALRIAVNNEFIELLSGLQLARQLLKPGAPCLVLSFHSLEDRLVKRVFANRSLDDLCCPAAWADAFKRQRSPQSLHAKPPPPLQPQLWQLVRFDSNRGEDYLMAGPAEVAENPRARSARLRVGLKL
ncbi:hypothetical protein BOX15_Mlig020506g1, partial [Macrostomum lignano]